MWILLTVNSSLYRIQGDIIRDMYNQNVGFPQFPRPDEFFGKILKLDQDLSEWQSALPLTMTLVPPEDLAITSPQDWPHTRSQTVLTIRYWNVRLLLHRPVISRCLENVANGKMAWEESESSYLFVNGMLKICIDSATNLISLIRAVASRAEMLPAWWFTAYYGELKMRRALCQRRD